MTQVGSLAEATHYAVNTASQALSVWDCIRQQSAVLLLFMSADGAGPRKRRKLSPPDPGPYVLRDVLDHIPLKAEDDQEDVSITCVEYWSRFCAGEIG
jgi:hypothetical protein